MDRADFYRLCEEVPELEEEEIDLGDCAEQMQEESLWEDEANG